MKIEENHIYKFAPINTYTLKNLILSELWFGPPNSMNDQLEGLITVKNIDFKPSKKAIKNFFLSNNLSYYYDYYLHHLNKVTGSVFLKLFLENWYNLKRNQFGITCFSDTPKEPLMWAHYADKHTGICLVFDKQELIKCLNTFGPKFSYSEINYEKRPEITLIEANDNITYHSNEPLITYKAPNWKYEKEIRFYSKFSKFESFKGFSSTIYYSALKAVIYGSNMDESDVNAVSIILRNEPLYKHVKEYNANLNYENGEIFFTKD